MLTTARQGGSSNYHEQRFPANSASDCLRFAKFRPQFSESCGATYILSCNRFRKQGPNRFIIDDAIVPKTGTKLTKKRNNATEPTWQYSSIRVWLSSACMHSLKVKSRTFVVSVARLLVSRRTSSLIVVNTPASNLSLAISVQELSNARLHNMYICYIALSL